MSDWIKWKGGEMPVPKGTYVEVEHLIGGKYFDFAGEGYAENWELSTFPNAGDIVAYRVVKRAPEAIHEVFTPEHHQTVAKAIREAEKHAIELDAEVESTMFLSNMFHKGIGDVNSTEKGSGARFNTGKPDFSLIPLSTMEDEARVWMYGKEKYAAWNWAKGMDWSVPFACAMRHFAAWQKGEDLDPESGQKHLAHVMANVRMLLLYSETYPEGDDRPKEWLSEFNKSKQT